MPDHGERATEIRYMRLKMRVEKVYRQAYRDVTNKAAEFDRRHLERAAKYSRMVAAGKMSKDDYAAWLRGQVFQSEQWKARQRQIDEILRNADTTARRMINEGRYDVFAQNANYMGYALEHDGGVNTGFALYDDNAVRRLIEDNPDILPPRKIPGKDKSYKWYNRQVNSAITQGIIQGEDIRQIAKRIGKLTGEANCSAMLRNARTAYTGAQNAGRIEGLHQAQRLGIKVKKQWLAILDDRTRDSHADLDGKTAEVDEPFKSPLGNIMYPGDQSAVPANVWNCRCTLTYVYPEYPSEMTRRDALTGEVVGNMSYKEWEAWKKGESEQEERPPTNIYGETIQFHDGFDSPKGEECKTVILKLADEFKTKLRNVRRGQKGEFANFVEFSGNEMHLRQLRIESAIHEFAHTITQKAQTKYGLVNDSEFWKEITKIRTQYRKHVREYPLEIISAYERAESSNIDEFFAEAFTLGYMRKNGIETDEYGKDTEFCIRVYNTALKYFGKHKWG